MEQKQYLSEGNEPFDLHLHSSRSDGSDAPADVIANAVRRGITLLALTDHDGVGGVPEAVRAGEALGARVIPAIEMDTEWQHELHILGLDIDIYEPRLTQALNQARARRSVRNAEIVSRLKRAGYDIRPYLAGGTETCTRLNIALALVAGGFASGTKDAFLRFLRKGCPGYYTAERFTPEEVIALIRGAGGVPVWAHPMHGHPDPHKLALQLQEYGLMGLEAYHPSMTEGDAEILVSIARQNGLIVTCGSDYHGANRPEVSPGQTWRNNAVLSQCRAFFEERPVRIESKEDERRTKKAQSNAAQQ
ncbi:MAG: PHP domain-containing protein [Eubacteriales bacterium]|nr:PHP domain-containing protein [Eubacteriales bacterium]